MTPPVQIAAPFAIRQIPTLLRGEAEPILAWMARWSAGRMFLYAGVIVLGTASFGGAVGVWRDPMQALYTAIKFPLIVMLTALGNGLLNGMFAPLLGVNITFRQSLLAILMSFTIAAAVLGACSPLMYFVIWNAPAFSNPTDPATLTTHSFIFVALAAAMAAAGIAGNVRLLQLLRQMSGSATAARRTLLAWLAGNLLLGSQLAWILRPFVGAPYLPVEFLRKAAFEGDFFEALFNHARHLFP
jgi:hypothetical protein